MPGYHKRIPDQPAYLRPGEAADILHVDVKTVNRWAKEGKLPFMHTLGGHRRYPEAKIREIAATLVGTVPSEAATRRLHM